MEPYLKNLDVWCWKYRENVKNYPGLHLTATADACDALLRCLQTLRQEGHGAERSVPLRPLAKADEAKITGGQPYVSFSTLRLIYRDATPELRRLHVCEAAEVALIEFTEEALHRLRRGIEDVKEGHGDYSIGPPNVRKELRALGEKDRASASLWFWPCFGHLWPV